MSADLSDERWGDPVERGLNQLAVEELSALEMPVIPANILTAVELMMTSQIPGDLAEELFSAQEAADEIGTDGPLVAFMERNSLRSIMHSEGRSVWDHTRLGLTLIEALEESSGYKRCLKIAYLYHDSGKPPAALKYRNCQTTRKRREMGSIRLSSRGHDCINLDIVAERLSQNPVSEEEQRAIFMVVRYHMLASPETLPLDAVKAQIETFGATFEQRRLVCRLLDDLKGIDRQATHYIIFDGDRVQRHTCSTLAHTQAWSSYL